MSPDNYYRFDHNLNISNFLKTEHEELFEEFIKETGEENINNHILHVPLNERTIILIINFWRLHLHSSFDVKYYKPLVNITSDILEYIGRLKSFEEIKENERKEKKKEEKEKENVEGK